jgi:hypothetical protein
VSVHAPWFADLGRLQFWLQGWPDKGRPWAVAWLGNRVSDLRFWLWQASGAALREAEARQVATSKRSAEMAEAIRRLLRAWDAIGGSRSMAHKMAVEQRAEAIDSLRAALETYDAALRLPESAHSHPRGDE